MLFLWPVLHIHRVSVPLLIWSDPLPSLASQWASLLYSCPSTNYFQHSHWCLSNIGPETLQNTSKWNGSPFNLDESQNPYSGLQRPTDFQLPFTSHNIHITFLTSSSGSIMCFELCPRVPWPYFNHRRYSLASQPFPYLFFPPGMLFQPSIHPRSECPHAL